MTIEIPLPLDRPEGWVLAGHGAFHHAGNGVIESRGGPGILWYTEREFGDFALSIEWQLSSPTDNSGVFVRIPRLGTGDREEDWKPAVARGYEVQIDGRGIDHESGTEDSPLHRTGAIYERASATVRASKPPGAWNMFSIDARGGAIAVTLNGMRVSRLVDAHGPRRGYVGLQAHDERSRVRFRNLRITAADGD